MKVKKLIASALAASMVVPMVAMNSLAAGGSGVNMDGSVLLNSENFPDANVLNTLKGTDYNPNGDDMLSAAEIEDIKAVDLSNLAITSVDGLQYLTAMESLDMRYTTGITNLDTRPFTKLSALSISYSGIETLRLDNPNLMCLDASHSPIRRLNLVNCPNMAVLSVTSCPNLSYLCIAHNDLLRATKSDGIDYGTSDEHNYQYTDEEMGFCALSYDSSTTLALRPPVGGYNIEKTFKDDILIEYLYDCIDTNRNGYVCDVTDDVISLAPSDSTYAGKYMGITDLTGISVFEDLDYIDFSGQPITSIDLSPFFDLLYLDLSLTGITNLDLSSNSKLCTLYLVTTPLTSLDVSYCPNLQKLDISDNYNPMSEIDISNNPDLLEAYKLFDSDNKFAGAYNNYYEMGDGINFLAFDVETEVITSIQGIEICEENFKDPAFREYLASDLIDLNGNGYLSTNELQADTIDITCNDSLVSLQGINLFKNLKNLYVYDCPFLQDIDVSENTELIHLYASGTAITELDVTHNPNLEELEVYDTFLTSIDLHNCPKLYRFDIAWNNNRVDCLDISFNPYLIDLYNNRNNISSTYSYNGVGYIEINADSHLLSYDLSAEIITDRGILISEDNFEDPELRRFFSEKLDKNGDGYLNKYEIDPDDCSIDISDDYNISSLDGIELFPGLKGLFIYEGTNLRSVDLSANPELEYLCLVYTGLQNIDISHNTKLVSVVIAVCELNSIDLSGCPNLVNLELPTQHGKLKSIDISHNPSIIDIYLHGSKKTCQSVDNSGSYYEYSKGEYFFSFDTTTTVITGIPTSQPTTPTTSPSQPSQPSNPSTPAQTAEGGVAGFVERLYTVALGRASDPNGKAAWIAAIRGGESGAQAAKGFLFSDEFLNKNMSNADFVTILYKTFFDRQPDAAGHAAWVAALERGESKQDVIMGFINSTEWANVCLRYGIISGGTGTPSIEVEPNEQVIAFATRLYSTCLKRTPDNAGLMAWARQLANLRDTGSNAAHGFFFSDEMNNNPVSDEEFVTRLYLTFMDRNPDQAGFDAWVGQLKAGTSREDVFQGFAQSTEFGQICANYGIIK